MTYKNLDNTPKGLNLTNDGFTQRENPRQVTRTPPYYPKDINLQQRWFLPIENHAKLEEPILNTTKG